MKWPQSSSASSIPFLVSGTRRGTCPAVSPWVLWDSPVGPCFPPAAPWERKTAHRHQVGFALVADRIPHSLGAVRTSAVGNRAGITGGTWCAFLQLSPFCGHSLFPPSLGNKQWSGAAWGQSGSSLSNSSSSSAPASPYKQTEVSLWSLNGCKRQHSSPGHPQAGPLSHSCLCHSTLTHRWNFKSFLPQEKRGVVICPWVTL